MSYLKGGLALISKARDELSYSTQPQAVETEVARNPATQYLNLNSADRGKGQPWNNFTLQKQESLMNAFATRVLVSEIMFPWYIPNVNQNNNGSYSQLIGAPEGINDFLNLGIRYYDGTTGAVIPNDDALPDYMGHISIPLGFYTPTTLIDALNTAGAVAVPSVGSAPKWGYDETTGAFNVIAQGNVITLVLNNIDYANTPTLFSLMNIPIEMLSVNSTTTTNNVYLSDGAINEFNPSQLLYTSYVDIVSQKSNQYANTRDGTSDNRTSTTVLCRVFCADEVSLPTVDGVAGHAPFVIHRQFKNPKSLMWNKNSVIDWFDIELYDEWGLPVPLPFLNFETVSSFDPPVAVQRTLIGSYPDFQITLLASEN